MNCIIHETKLGFSINHPAWFGGFNLPLWKMMEVVSWDDELPNWMESHKISWFQSPPISHAYSITIGWITIESPWNHH
jgi:hypothetical protein